MRFVSLATIALRLTGLAGVAVRADDPKGSASATAAGGDHQPTGRKRIVYGTYDVCDTREKDTRLARACGGLRRASDSFDWITSDHNMLITTAEAWARLRER